MNIEHDIFNTKPRKKGINSKRKGDNNERDLAKYLSKWTGYQFERVPSSGGLGWKDSVQTVGDVVCTTPNSRVPFTFETKALKKLGLNSPILRSNSCIFKHWHQCHREGEQANRIPLFIARDNGMKKYTWWVFMDYSLYELINTKIFKHGQGYGLPHHFLGYNKTYSFDLVGVHSDDFKTIDYKKLEDEISKL